MTEKKRTVLATVLVLYVFEMILLKFRGGGMLFGNMIFMFPIGVILPKLWERCKERKKLIGGGIVFNIILELIQLSGGGEIHIFYAVSTGTAGILLGYAGYYISENT